MQLYCHLTVIATALLNLGHAQSEEGSVKEAEGNLTKALDIYRKLHGENHRLIALTLNYLGYVYLQMGQVWKAKETLERAVKIMNNHSPSEHPGILSFLKYTAVLPYQFTALKLILLSVQFSMLQ